MLGLVVRALLGRRAPTITLLLLTILSAGAAAAAPQYIASTVRDLASASADAAPITQRVLAGRIEREGNAVSATSATGPAGDLQNAIGLDGVTAIGGLQVTGSVESDRDSSTSLLAHRTGFCEHLVLEGRCPAATGEVALNRATADRLGVGVGDRVSYQTPGVEDLPLQVTAVYLPRDPFEDYWAGRRLVSVAEPGDPGAAAQSATAALLTVPETIVQSRPRTVIVTVDAIATREAFARTPPLEIRDAVREAQDTLTKQGYETSAPLRTLAVSIYNSQLDIVWAVPVSLAELLAFCWIALFLAVRHGALERHRDVGLLKLRGSGRPRMMVLTIGQSAAPMLAGGLLGLAAALPMRPPSGALAADTARLADLASLAAAALAVLGALVAATVAERRALAAPVALLLRAVPPRKTGWRYGTVDAVLVVLALAGAYEARSYAGSEGIQQSTWLALLAPALLALALGVVLARLLVPVAARVARSTLRSGRLGVAVTAFELARRPAVPRLTALLTAGVALLCTAATAADSTHRSGAERASNEVGADRVLQVGAPSRTRLVAAVREVDPEGRFAMAVAASPATGILAVDATRLATVARWRGEYGGADPAAIAARLRPDARRSITVTGTTFTLEASADSTAAGVSAALVAADGTILHAEFGPVTGARAAYREEVPECAAGCRLVSWTLVPVPPPGAPPGVPPAYGATHLHLLTATGAAGGTPGNDEGATPSQTGTPSAPNDKAGTRGASSPETGPRGVDTATLGDRPRWRTANGPGGRTPSVAAGPDGLSIPPGPPTVVQTVWVDDGPERLPALASGARGNEMAAADPQLLAFPGIAVPVDEIGRAEVLPRAGRTGVLVDLETAELMTGDLGGADSYQVWATRDAPADLEERLEAHGVTTVTSATIDALADRYGRQAPPATIRFQLVTAVLMVLLAAGALGVVVAVERRPRTGELLALRRQGLRARTAARAALGGYLVVAGIALPAGALTAVLARTTFAVPAARFPDGWDVLPAPAAVGLVPMLLAVGGAALVFGAVVALAAGRVRGRLRRLEEEVQ